VNRFIDAGVEVGQLMAMALLLVFMTRWRASPSFARQAHAANVLMMNAGFALTGIRIAGVVTA
jgi:hypothetical protein